MSLPQPMIVLVNDEDIVRHRASAVLRTTGFAVRSYRHAGPALADLTRLGADLIILDWTNPPLHRLPLWRQMRGAHPQLPVLYMSAHADEVAERLRAEPVPPVATVQLPCVFERTLVSTVTRCLALGAAGGASLR